MKPTIEGVLILALSVACVILYVTSTKESEMQQEDYNSVMKYPWEITRKPHNEKLPDCPRCGEPYCGDGTQLCVECNLIKDDDK